MNSNRKTAVLVFLLFAAVLPLGMIACEEAQAYTTQTPAPISTQTQQISATDQTVIPDAQTLPEAERTPDAQTTQDTLEPSQTPQFVQAPQGYFEDALFIGDSRTIGLQEYGSIEGATFFATTGMSVYNVWDESVNVASCGGKVTLDTLLNSRSFGKIYVMLGINELGYNRDKTVQTYQTLIESLQQRQEDAIIYILANLHVSEKRSSSDAIFNNDNLNGFNQQIAALADQKQIFYLDVNPLFDDVNGNLAQDYTSDDTHILGKYYIDWGTWLASNVIVR